MNNYQIQYAAKFKDGDKSGIYLVNADNAYLALQEFDREMSEKDGLRWIIHREFINQ